jgi:glycerophosphoryl diester phosphodiesterase
MTAPPAPAPRAEGRPLVLGHRGASAAAPENTLAAFRLAREAGADGVELDVWRCGSGEVVVIHDEDARRTCGAPDLVTATPLTRLRALDAGAWKAPRFAGERIPLLAEVLEALPGAVVNVELKARRGAPDLALAEAVAGVVAAARAEARVLVSSFDVTLLAAFRRAAPGVPSGLLLEAGWTWRLRLPLGWARLQPSALHPDRRLCTEARLAGWVREGRVVNVWTVDDPAEADRLARAGVAGIITNRPEVVREAVRRVTGR